MLKHLAALISHFKTATIQKKLFPIEGSLTCLCVVFSDKINRNPRIVWNRLNYTAELHVSQQPQVRWIKIT